MQHSINANVTPQIRRFVTCSVPRNASLISEEDVCFLSVKPGLLRKRNAFYSY